MADAAIPPACPMHATAHTTGQSAPQANDLLTDPASFAHLQQVVRLLCASALVPDRLKKNDGADALLALQIARECGEPPLTVMQNLHLVAGRAGWSVPYLIARAHRSGVFTGRIRWHVEGRGSDALAVTARATLADTGEKVAAEASLALARAEGWDRTTRHARLPEPMLRDRSAAMLVRRHCPEVLLGLPTADELDDLAAAGRSPEAPPPQTSAAEAVSAILRAPP